MTTLYSLEHLDLATGKRAGLPWWFRTRQEAQDKVDELTQADPSRVYIIKLVPRLEPVG